MWLLVALAAWGHVCLHSISHQVYTWYISGIYLVYANKNVIYQVYTWYILMGKSIYQVYTWYKTCIYLSYDDIQYIPDIHLLKTFCDISVPVTLRFGHGIYLVYTVCRHIPGLYQVYTRYIPDIYYYQLVYTTNIPGIWYLWCHMPGIY